VFGKNRLPYPTPADDDRVGGARLMDELLSRRPDPGLYISENCEHLLETIPTLMRDDRNVEDVRKVDGQRSDDIYDACRYTLKSQLGAGDMPLSVQRQKILAACGTNQERYFTDLGFQARKKQGIGITFGRRRY
jgi:hypothetical protein